MGDQGYQQTLGDLLEIKDKYMNNSSRILLWKKVMEAQAKRTWLGSWKQKMNSVRSTKHHSSSSIMKTRRHPRRSNSLQMMKRRRGLWAGQEGFRRSTTTTVIERKVRTLKKLIPNADSSVGLDGLFRETAEYISNLQMRVRIMQVVVDALSNSE